MQEIASYTCTPHTQQNWAGGNEWATTVILVSHRHISHSLEWARRWITKSGNLISMWESASHTTPTHPESRRDRTNNYACRECTTIYVKSSGQIFTVKHSCQVSTHVTHSCHEFMSRIHVTHSCHAFMSATMSRIHVEHSWIKVMATHWSTRASSWPGRYPRHGQNQIDVV